MSGFPETGRASAPARYGLAVLAVALAVLVRWGLSAWLGTDVPLILFVLSVAASATYGGAGPGLLATFLSIVAGNWLFVPPAQALPVTATGWALRLALLGLVGVVVSLLSEMRQRAAEEALLLEKEARKQEAALRDSDERYRRIVENAHEGIWQIDAQARTVYANRRMAEMLGYTEEELAQKDPFSLVPEDELPAARAAWAEEARKPGREGDFAFRHKDGRELWLHCSATPTQDESGEFTGVLGMFTDVTARRQGEAALRRSDVRRETQLAVSRIVAEAPALADALPRLLDEIGEGLGFRMGGVWVVDTQANVLRCRATAGAVTPEDLAFETATRAMTLAPGRGLPGRVWTAGEPAWIADLEQDPDFPAAAEAEAAALRCGAAFPLVMAGETLGVMEFFGTEARPEDPEILAAFLVLGSQIGHFLQRARADKERTELLSREQAARREAETASRTKDEFLATLSHELRTPLNAIVGWSHLLRTGQLEGDKVTRAVEIIDRNARAQSQVISDVLDVSRIVMGRLRLDVRECDLRAIVQAALDAVSAAARGKDIRLNTDIDEAGGSVSADPDRLQQVVWNLLSNAVRFTPSGGEVSVRLRDEKDAVEVVVEDTGPGISSEFLPYVFDRFRQHDSSTTRAHGGLGLGLALVRDLVEMHGGSVSVTSRENHGARFTVRLPRLSERPAATAVSASSLRNEAGN